MWEREGRDLLRRETYSALQTVIGMVKVVHIRLSTDPGGHRRDVETEEASSDGAEGGENYSSLLAIMSSYRVLGME